LLEVGGRDEVADVTLDEIVKVSRSYTCGGSFPLFFVDVGIFLVRVRIFGAWKEQAGAVERSRSAAAVVTSGDVRISSTRGRGTLA
jgi:hypothetical protein